MKRRFVCQLIIFTFLTLLYAQTNLRKRIKNDYNLINDISLKRLINAQKDDATMEDYYYQQSVWKQEELLKARLDDKKIKSNVLNGNWELYNNTFFVDKNGFYIGRTLTFTDLNGFCNYQHQGSNSFVYEIGINKYLVFPTMDAGIIRLLYFESDKLYIYNLDGDFWILDDIHLNGAYYKKID